MKIYYGFTWVGPHFILPIFYFHLALNVYRRFLINNKILLSYITVIDVNEIIFMHICVHNLHLSRKVHFCNAATCLTSILIVFWWLSRTFSLHLFLVC